MTNLSINSKRLRIPFGLAILCGVIFTANINLGVNWVWELFGMKPGVAIWERPWTLFTANLIHGDTGHLVGNISVFAPTAIYLAFKGFKFRNLYWVMPFVGMFTWLFGNDHSTHGGFSGVVFFVVSAAILEVFKGPRVKIIDAAYAIFALGKISMLVVLVTPLAGVSFEGHLAGVIASGIWFITRNYNIIFALNLTKKH
jgi:membrane associated rhomboid family serine protease